MEQAVYLSEKKDTLFKINEYNLKDFKNMEEYK